MEERRANPKCLAGSVPDTLSARSGDLTSLKMNRITRGALLDYLAGTLAAPRRAASTTCRTAVITRSGSVSWMSCPLLAAMT